MSRLVGDSWGFWFSFDRSGGEKSGEFRCKRNWVGRCLPVFPAFGKPRQEHDEFKDGLGYIVRL